MAQIILEVEEEFFEAGAGSVEQAQFSLRGSGGSAAPLGNVLPAGTLGLNHLVHSAGTRVEAFFTEPVGGIVDEGGSLETAGGPVAAAGTQPLAGAGLGRRV